MSSEEPETPSVCVSGDVTVVHAARSALLIMSRYGFVRSDLLTVNTTGAFLTIFHSQHAIKEHSYY